MSVMVKCPHCARLSRLQEGRDNEVRCKCGLVFPPRNRTFVAIVRPVPGGPQLRRKLAATNKREALAEEAQLLIETREAARKDPNRTTWGDIAYAYLRRLDVDGLAETYQADTRRYLAFMGDAWGDDTLCTDITDKHVKDLKLKLRESGRSEATVDRYHAAGRAAWRYSLPDLPNPFSHVRQYLPDNEVQNTLTRDERERFLAVARGLSQQLYEIILVAITTGIRKSAVCRLQRSQVDFERKAISIILKGGRSHTVPLSEPIANLLKSVSDNGTPYFWVSPKSGEPYRKDWRLLNRAKKLAGIDHPFRFHDLRHEAGSHLYALTKDLLLTRDLLGHRDTRTTLRYAHLLPDKMKAGMDRLASELLSNCCSLTRNPNDTDNGD